MPSLMMRCPPQALSLDHNMLKFVQLTLKSVSSITSLNLGGNTLLAAVPSDLHHLVACRSLAITVKAPLRAGLGGDLAASPLLQMPALRRVFIAQQTWPHEDVETLLELRQAFDRRRGCARPPRILCPRPEGAEAPAVPGHAHGFSPHPIILSDEDGDFDDPNSDEYSDDGYSDEYSGGEGYHPW